MTAELTGSQRSFLRSLANSLPCRTAVGKGGISPTSTAHVRGLLEECELVKVRLLPAAGEDRFALAGALTDATGSVLVALVGRVAILFRQSRTLPPGQRIQLPGR